MQCPFVAHTFVEKQWLINICFVAIKRHLNNLTGQELVVIVGHPYWQGKFGKPVWKHYYFCYFILFDTPLVPLWSSMKWFSMREILFKVLGRCVMSSRQLSHWACGSRSNNLKQPHSKSVGLRHRRVARWSGRSFYFLKCRFLVLKLNAVSVCSVCSHSISQIANHLSVINHIHIHTQ